jgi:hypothetical protein
VIPDKECMRGPRTLQYLWNDHAGAVALLSTVLAAVVSGSVGYGMSGATAETNVAAAQPTQATASDGMDRIKAVSLDQHRVTMQLADAQAELVRERARSEELEQQLEEEKQAAQESSSMRSTAATAAEATTAATATTGSPARPRSMSLGEACSQATRLFSDHDSSLAGVISGDNDAKRTGHSLGADIMQLQNLAAEVGGELGPLLRAYAAVLVDERQRLLAGADMSDEGMDRFYATADAFKNYCAEATDPLAR